MKHEAAILHYLFNQRDEKNSKAISKALRLDNTEVCKSLYHLRKNQGLIYHSRGKFNKLTDKGVRYCEQDYAMKHSDVIDNKADETQTQGVAMTEEAASYKADNNDDGLSQSLVLLEQNLKGREIKNLKVKLDLLSKLSDLMDESIGEVLNEIATDLSG